MLGAELWFLLVILKDFIPPGFLISMIIRIIMAHIIIHTIYSLQSESHTPQGGGGHVSECSATSGGDRHAYTRIK